MLVKVAKLLKKEAGWLSNSGDLITKGLFNSGKKELAHVSQLGVGEAVQQVGAALKGAVSTKNIASQVQKFSHVLKDGTKITADQFAKLGPSARMFAKPLAG